MTHLGDALGGEAQVREEVEEGKRLRVTRERVILGRKAGELARSKGGRRKY